MKTKIRAKKIAKIEVFILFYLFKISNFCKILPSFLWLELTMNQDHVSYIYFFFNLSPFIE